MPNGESIKPSPPQNLQTPVSLHPAFEEETANSSSPSATYEETTSKLLSFLHTASGKPSLIDEEDRDIPFDELDTDESFERSAASSNVVGRSSAATPNSNAHHRQACNLSSNLSAMNDKVCNHSPELEIPSLSRATSSSALQDLQDPPPFCFKSHSSDFEHEGSPKIELDLEAFEDCVLTKTFNLRDDFRCSSYSSSALRASESTEFPSC